MNIKSLILGSAAALVGVSGAQAADAIIAEPEPVEYVRVCDAYGAGYFYIPGTETCLKIGGLVFYDIGASSYDNAGDTPGFVPAYDVAGAAGEWNKFIRARVNFDARSETEWGTLRSFVEFEANNINGAISADAGVAINQAFLSIGGLLMGYTESAYYLTPNAPMTNGVGFAWWPSRTYAYQQRQLIQYNFSGGNGFFATLSLENDPGTGNYMPDVVGKIGVQQAWGAVHVAVAYDEDTFEYTGANDDAFSIKAGLHLNVANAPGSAFRLVGFYNSDRNRYDQSAGAFGFGSEWSVFAGYQHAFSPQLKAFIGGQYFSDVFTLSAIAGNSVDAFNVETGVIWTPVTNFEVRAEAYYTKADGFDDTVSGFLRFTRYF